MIIILNGPLPGQAAQRPDIPDTSFKKEIYRWEVKGRLFSVRAGAIWASPWAYNDKIWFFNESGVTRVMKAGENYELLSENKLDDKFWASVAVAGDAYIFRGVEKLYYVGQ